jgi:hypothetical protein
VVGRAGRVSNHQEAPGLTVAAGPGAEQSGRREPGRQPQGPTDNRKGVAKQRQLRVEKVPPSMRFCCPAVARAACL